MLFFLLLILGVEAVSADRCSSIPPSLWCSNKELMNECGFTDKCNRYLEATNNQRINITVLVEALCPDCQRWIVEELYPHVFKNFVDFVNIELIPYGNAKIVNGSIQCQHGPEECSINRFESCVIDSMQTQDQYIPFINCIESQLMIIYYAHCMPVYSFLDESGTSFLLQRGRVWFHGSENSFKKRRLKRQNMDETASIPPKLLKLQLLKPGMGFIRLKGNEDITCLPINDDANVWPDKHTHVPWIVVNGVSLANGQMMMDHLPYLICDWYVGDKRIPFCQYEEKRKLKRANWKF